jgi:hypothetical protein
VMWQLHSTHLLRGDDLFFSTQDSGFVRPAACDVYAPARGTLSGAR